MSNQRIYPALFGVLLFATFLGSYSWSQDNKGAKDKNAAKKATKALPAAIPEGTVKTLRDRHKVLMADVAKIEMAAKHIVEIRKQRATGLYIINDYELKMERTGKKDFHIFMERYRNDTLETLALLDKVLGKQAFVDPLRAVFGKHLEDRIEILWDDYDLEAVVEELETGFGVTVEIEGDYDVGHTISFEGKMTLLAALLQIENLFDVRMRVDGKKLIYVVPNRELTEK